MTKEGLIYATIILVGGTFIGFALGRMPGLLIGLLVSAVLAAVTIYGYGGKRKKADNDIYLNVSQNDEQRLPTKDRSQLPQGFYNNKR